MKKIKFMALFLSMALVFGSCGSMNNTAKGGVIVVRERPWELLSVVLPVKEKVLLSVLQ